MFQRLLLRIILITIFVVTLFCIIAYARGYRFSLKEQAIVPTGILVASSTPDGAKVYLNGIFKGATNSNITLPPGVYDIDIKKEGYTAWKKKLTVKGELVVRTDALLFPQNPSLSPLTSLGLVKAVYFEESTKIVIFAPGDATSTEEAQLKTDAPSAETSGVYILENGRKPTSLFGTLKLIAGKSVFPTNLDFQNTKLRMSPDGRQLLLKMFSSNSSSVKPIKSYLLSTSQETQQPFDVTKSYKNIETAWDRLALKKTGQLLDTFKDPLPTIASDSFKIISFSPDETKILYTPLRSIILQPIITPGLIATNQTEEDRNLKVGRVYVYDKKDDRNYLIDTAKLKDEKGKMKKEFSIVNFQFLNSPIWHPDSAHLILNENDKILVVDYDGTHRQIVYSGPFEKNFLAVTSDGKLMILANLNPQTNQLPDVYAVGIR